MSDVIIEVKTLEVINREALFDPTMRVGCLPCGDEDSDAASAYSEPLAAQIRYVVEDFCMCARGYFLGCFLYYVLKNLTEVLGFIVLRFVIMQSKFKK